MMMILRLRSRDGMELVAIDSHATIGQLKEAIAKQIHVPIDEQYLSIDRDALLSKNCDDFRSFMIDEKIKLRLLNISHGDILYLYYQCEERKVSKTYQKLEFNNENPMIEQVIESLTKVSMKRPRQEITFEENNIKRLKPYFDSNQNVNTIDMNTQIQVVEGSNKSSLKRMREEMTFQENKKRYLQARFSSNQMSEVLNTYYVPK